MQNASDCIFASSKYYKQAYADALRISEPLGYNFLSRKFQIPVQKTKGPLIRKLLFEKPLVKIISNKPTPLQKVHQHLSVSDSKRKNTYLSANPLSIINKTTQQICEQLSTKFLPNIQKSNKQTIDFVNSLNSISDDVLFSINDFALSTYFVCYFGKNPQIGAIAKKIMEDQFIQYHVKTITSERSLDTTGSHNDILIEFHENNLKNKSKIDDYIYNINQQGLKCDAMYSGIHFFIGDCVAPASSHEILKEQISNLKYLQFYLYLLTSGMLGNGQNALIKIRGSMRNKTIDFLFLFKLAFSKISLIKPAFSNFLSSQKYLFCEGYLSQNGDTVHKFISDNFEMLAQHGEEKLLVNPQLIFREEILADNTKNFNDSLIIRGLKQILDTFLKNSNIEIFPPKSHLIEKLTPFNHIEDLKKIIQTIESTVPTEEEIKLSTAEEDPNRNDNRLKDQSVAHSIFKPDLEEKEPSLDVFAILQQAKQQAKPVQNVESSLKRVKKDENQQIEERMLGRFKEQERIREEKKKQRKQKQKKQKEQKDEDPYAYGSRFQYAEG